MAEININQMNVEQMMLKKFKDAGKAEDVENTEVKNESIDVLIKKFCKGGYASFQEFSNALVANGVIENSIKTTTLKTSNGETATNVQLIFTMKNSDKTYIFNVPAEYVNNLEVFGQEPNINENKPEPDRGVIPGVNGLQGSGVIGSTLDLPSYEEQYSASSKAYTQAETTWQLYMNEELTDDVMEILLNLHGDCSANINEIDNYIKYKDGLNNTQKSNLNLLSINFILLQRYVAGKLNPQDPGMNRDAYGTYQNVAVTKLECMRSQLDGGNLQECILGLSYLEPIISELLEYQSDFPDLKERTNEIVADRNELHQGIAEKTLEEIDNLNGGTKDEICKLYEESWQELQKLSKELKENFDIGKIAKLSATIEKINNWSDVAKVLQKDYNHEIVDPEVKEEVKDNLKYAYKQYGAELLQNEDVSMLQKVKELQDMKNILELLFPDIELVSNFDYVIHGWETGDLPNIDFIANLLPEDAKAKYDQLLELDTASWNNRNLAIDLISDIVDAAANIDLSGYPLNEQLEISGKQAEFVVFLNARLAYLEVMTAPIEENLEVAIGNDV